MRFLSSETVSSAEVGMIELLICLKALVVSQTQMGLLLDPKESIGPPPPPPRRGRWEPIITPYFQTSKRHSSSTHRHMFSPLFLLGLFLLNKPMGSHLLFSPPLSCKSDLLFPCHCPDRPIPSTPSRSHPAASDYFIRLLTPPPSSKSPLYMIRTPIDHTTASGRCVVTWYP